MAKASKEQTMLQAAIPHGRGPATHIEHEDDTAYTKLGPDGQVKEIHTPADAFKRVHEVLHARHSKPDTYPDDVPSYVSDIIEDCRLHMHHWPWLYGETPEAIKDSGLAALLDDLQAAQRTKSKKMKHYSEFAARLRALTVMNGMDLDAAPKDVDKFKFSRMQERLAYTLHDMIRKGQHKHAATVLAETFGLVARSDEEEEAESRAFSFDDDGDAEVTIIRDVDGTFLGRSKVMKKLSRLEAAIKRTERDEPDDRWMAGARSRMTMIELAHTIPTSHLVDGFRVAKTGHRIYRPALRRPVLPQRIFWRHSPTAPAGAVLFDASGSMSVTQEVLQDCCLRAPMATVAYYAGNDGDGTGTLCVFAKAGLRAEKIKNLGMGGNGIDGPALSWLMAQDGPRVFVTDRGFTGMDAAAQRARLDLLEQLGEVTVYRTFKDFKEAFPPVEIL